MTRRRGARVLEGIPHFALIDLPPPPNSRAADPLSKTARWRSSTFRRARPACGRGLPGQLIHTIPCTQMYTDAMVQFLVLQALDQHPGPARPGGGRATCCALRDSANFFGARDDRPAAIRPRHRPAQSRADQRRPDHRRRQLRRGTTSPMLTADFGGYVPFEINHPRPALGAIGLIRDAWHWSWDGGGAAARGPLRGGLPTGAWPTATLRRGWR